MKPFLTVFLFAVLTGVSAYSAPTQIPDDQLGNYKQATILAIYQQEMSCKIASGNKFGSMYADKDIDSAEAGYVDFDGQQPLLTFVKKGNDTKENPRKVVTVVTASDFKTILSIRDEYFLPGFTNTGDLKNPVLAKGYESSVAMVCKAE